LRDVLRALAGAHVDRVWVVTRDAAAAAIARELGAEPVLEAENRGHTAAVALARAEATRRGARGFLAGRGGGQWVTAAETGARANAPDGTRSPPASPRPPRATPGASRVTIPPTDETRTAEPCRADRSPRPPCTTGRRTARRARRPPRDEQDAAEPGRTYLRP